MIFNFIEISLYTIIIKEISSCFIHHYFIKSFLHYHLISIKENYFSVIWLYVMIIVVMIFAMTGFYRKSGVSSLLT